MPNKKKKDYIKIDEIWPWLALIVIFTLIGVIVGKSYTISGSPECYATQEKCGIGYDILPYDNEDLLLQNVHLNECCKPPHYILQGINLMLYWNIPGSRYYSPPSCKTTTIQICENVILIDWQKDMEGCVNTTNPNITAEDCRYMVKTIGEAANNLIMGMCYRNVTTCQNIS